MAKATGIFCLETLIKDGELPVSIRDTPQAENTEPHLHDYVEIAFVRQGRGTHVNHFDDGSEAATTLIKGDVFTILPGEIHSYTECHNYRVYNLCIGREFFYSLDQELFKLKFFHNFFASNRPQRINQFHLSPIAFSEAEEKLRNLFVVLNKYRPSRNLAVKYSIIDLLLTVFDEDFKGQIKSGTEINANLFSAIARLELHPERGFELEKFAREAGMSVSGFSHKFKQIIGLSPGSYCLFLRLDNARKMLENKSISMTDIAIACGFNDSNYMIRSFKKRFGMTPGEYRNRFLQVMKE